VQLNKRIWEIIKLFDFRGRPEGSHSRLLPLMMHDRHKQWKKPWEIPSGDRV